jgi:hypothetical protein
MVTISGSTSSTSEVTRTSTSGEMMTSSTTTRISVGWSTVSVGGGQRSRTDLGDRVDLAVGVIGDGLGAGLVDPDRFPAGGVVGGSGLARSTLGGNEEAAVVVGVDQWGVGVGTPEGSR